MLHLSAALRATLLLLIPIQLLGQAQEQVFEGVIHDAADRPVELATIETSPGDGFAVTDADGAFRLSCSCPRPVTHLDVGHLAYDPIRIALDSAGDRSRLRIRLRGVSHQLSPVEVSGQPDALTTLLRSSQPVHVLTEAYFERHPSGTFATALEALPGVSSMKLGVGIAKPVIRGMSFNRVLVSNRGIKQEGQQWGADHGLEVDPFDIATVEVIKGPATLLYGSDGLGGVINIRPKTFRADNGRELEWTSGFQSNNRAFSNSFGVEGRRDAWVYSARATHQDYGDYAVPASEFTYAGFNLPIYDDRLKNTAGRELHYSVLAGRQTADYTSTVRFSAFNQEAGIFTGAMGLPQSYGLRHEGAHRDIDFPKQRNRHLMLVNNNEFSLGSGELELDLGVQWNTREELSFPGAHGIDASAVDSDLALALGLTTYTANVRYRREVGEQYTMLFGSQYQRSRNRRSGFEFLLPDYRSTQVGLFTYHVWDVAERWIVNAGVRYDYGTHAAERHLQPLFDRGTLLPTGEFQERTPAVDRRFGNLSGATGLSFVASARHNFKLNLGNSFRFPTVIELASNGVHHGNFRHERGDVALDVERGFQVDLTYLHTGPGARVELSGFYGYYQNFIYLSPSGRFSDLPSGGSLWQYRQDDALFNGLELLTAFELPADLHAQLVGELVQNLNLTTGLPLPLTPAASVTTELDYRGLGAVLPHLTKSSVSLGARAILAQNRVDRNERTTPGSFLVDLGVTTTLTLGERELLVRVNVDNVFDAAYANHISRYRLINLPEQGRNVTLQIKLPIELGK